MGAPDRQIDEQSNAEVDKFPSAPCTPDSEQLTVSTIISLSPDANYPNAEKAFQNNGKRPVHIFVAFY